jgi:hypothetical protein
MGKAQLAALALISTWVACQADPDARASGAGDAAMIAASDAGSDAASAPTGAVPCAVKALIDQHCGQCHGTQPQFGAPMALASLADFHAIGPGSQQPVHQAALDRVMRTGAGVMPPPPQPALPESAKSTLLGWLRAGAQPGDACAPGAVSDAGAPSDAGGTGAASNDCDVSFELRATDGRGGKFPIPLENDHYECFYFKAEVAPNTLATVLSPLLDDTRALHHWLLFAAPNEAEAPSGTHGKCDGIHPGAYLMAAWLPGTPALVMPADVGMEMPSGQSAQFILENHYNNTARIQNASDNSGVKVCATQKPKALHAAIHWLGSERIALEPNQPGSVQATCTPGGQQPIHILGVIPHMHRLGRRATMTILRANGSSEMMHDGPFEFENQAFYPKTLVLNPGDRVTTRCDYLNDTSGRVTLGERTSDEMCYMFTLAYPVGSMNTGGDYINPITGQPYVQGPNRCMR